MRAGSGGSAQVKLSGKWNSSGGSSRPSPRDHRVLEAEQHPRVDLEREVEVDRAVAALLGMQVDLPVLAQRVALDEVALVVHVEAVLDRVVLQIGDESGEVDDRHAAASADRARGRAAIASSNATFAGVDHVDPCRRTRGTCPS